MCRNALFLFIKLSIFLPASITVNKFECHQTFFLILPSQVPDSVDVLTFYAVSFFCRRLTALFLKREGKKKEKKAKAKSQLYTQSRERALRNISHEKSIERLSLRKRIKRDGCVGFVSVPKIIIVIV